ncbi:D-hexose-6-phosphate mutarotase [Pseudomonas sp. CCC3.1]|uniref:D-hexose-6-phosphate mutarotase n=1 Tax=Pseudomonas sp. CCC3.1 TaxID=3048607 RepID=UPI002AC97556|nr:D-hexose-6-phosphate mutarotase [Pseudomonas sp. CCC3.1]MEB0208323.1 D-hexose-6-phosphate mutarotase [Pseudomonas sp. CCC3.1]WPX36042.1 D-hexose-6-phosphate mutarotase [Pseudomonas sp. CCC3.1]
MHHIESLTLDELECWHFQHGQAQLLVAKQGAQVLSYQVGDEPPIVWLNEKAQFKEGKGIRTGMPVCWPWFGNLARNPQSVQAMRVSDEPATAHGLVRTREWEVLEIDDAGEALHIELGLPHIEGGLPGWPHDVALTLNIRLDTQLHVSLTSHNRSDTPVSISQALHSYFAVSDVRKVHVDGLDGLTYIETLDDWKHVQQNGALTFSGETDRIYLDTPQQLSIVDADWHRSIELTSRGSRTAVIWNPWTDKTATFSDMAPDGWQRMLCIETANVMDDVITLEPGASHTLGVSIASKQLKT